LVRQNDKYKDKDIVIDIPDEHGGHESHIHLSINNRDIHVMKLSTGKYSSHYLPYQKFSSIMELARALIDEVPLFSERVRK
jgi:hypothetical protein